MKNRFLTPMANNNDCFVPEIWAMESLAILQENMVAANLVHRDFSNEIAEFGDTVNTRRPNEFTAQRKTDTDDVTVQDASSTNVAVQLNQHIHTSFTIKDGERSKSMKDLVATYIQPAALSLARAVDQIVLGQYVHFLGNNAGQLGAMSSSNAKDYILDGRQVMNENKAYANGRNLIVTVDSETQMLKVAELTNAEKIGDNGTAMREASMGRRLGFDIFMSQNASYIGTGNTAKTGAINSVGGHAAGTTVLVVDGFTGTLTAGSFLKIAGDGTVLRVASSTATLGNATGITLTSGLKRAVADDAVVTVYTPGAVNLVAGYDAGYAKAIVVDGFTVAPKVGQLVAFGTASAVYTVIGAPTTTSITLDRPLEAAIANDDAVAIGPAGSYNLAFHKNALALVSRPLALPRSGLGASGGVASFNNIAMRVVMTYNGSSQGTLCTMDMLLGVKVLDTDLGCVILG